ncbi:unnamed protein product [Nezara viridula]|uniref:Uncharacterized protein n=1 Tax=Nezara viridula TaxID=85310 RepID=A0A9P0H240_NEZVI|nr:unnamed protein product [Nezara viridula]
MENELVQKKILEAHFSGKKKRTTCLEAGGRLKWRETRGRAMEGYCRIRIRVGPADNLTQTLPGKKGLTPGEGSRRKDTYSAPVFLVYFYKAAVPLA